jgi:uncharacterized protein YkwD
MINRRPVSREHGKRSVTLFVLALCLIAVTLVCPTPGFRASASYAAEESWLEVVNSYRALAGLPLVTEDPQMSHGCYLHARYMVKNDMIGHYEDPANPFYTTEGATAARQSNCMVSWSVSTTDREAIELWMTAPFHAVGILDPRLSKVGYGSYREADGTYQMAAALNVLGGFGPLPSGFSYPVMWPKDGGVVDLTTFYEGETPDPLTSAPGYEYPVGLPIILQLGPGTITPHVTYHDFRKGSTPLEHVVFDETSYVNPDPDLQDLGRAVLASRDAIVLIPRYPLQAGSTYTVTIASNGTTYTWSFAVKDTDPPSTPTLSTSPSSTNLSATKTFKVSWSASRDAHSGVSGYELQVKDGYTGTWKSLGITTVTYRYFTGSPGHTYYFRVRAVDRAQNYSPFSAVKYTIVPYDQTSLTFSSGWTTYRPSSLYLATSRASATRGTAATFRATGAREITLIATKRPTSGYARIYVNNVLVKTVNLYASTTRVRQAITIATYSSPRTVTVKVVVVRAKSSASRGYAVEIDGLAVRR